MKYYSDLINVDESLKRKVVFEEERGGLAFYCKNCEKIVDVELHDTNYHHAVCKECGGTQIVKGTFKGLQSHYHIS